jgi:threonylcarbamoyladenosine tRNA methylthiotransferase MtaB
VDDFGIAHSAGVDGRTRAFLKIQDGCDYNCSFCTIPLARGASRSLPIDEIITQAGQLAEMEYHEVVLTGVNIGDYGTKINSSLLELLKALDPLPGLDRLRISSIEPNLLSDELLNYWINNPRICNHFHMPLQSGANEILRSMRRRYGAQQYAERVLLIKEMDPEAGIGVDVIVGYPGESDKLFEETYTFLHDLPISYLHVFTYSERPHTPSMQLPDRVDAKVRGERSERLRILSRKKRDAFYSTQQGRTARVVFESDVENNLLSGYTDNYVRVMVPYYEELINATAVVHLGEPTPEGMNAVIVRIERSAKTDKENNLVK